MNKIIMSSKIEQLIDEIEEYIESCKFKALSSTTILVNKEEIEELLRELRMKTPDEIKRYQKIISNKEAILNDAREKAEALINEATVHTNELINEHEIMQQAYAQANEVVTLASAQAQEIVDNATMEANNLRASAIQYTDDLLAHIEDILTHTIQSSGAKYEEYMKSLNECYEIVLANRAELKPQDSTDEEISEDLSEIESPDNTINLDLI